MSGKTTLLLLTASVLLTSLLVVNLPQVNALVQRDFSILDDSHTTASYGYSKVCGNHLCAPGDHTKWLNAVWHSQSTSYGKVTNAPHGEDVMKQLAGTASSTMSSHGTTEPNSIMNGSSEVTRIS